MEPTTKATPEATAAALNKRMGVIYKWCDKRDIGQPYAFFRGCDPKIEAHEARIRLVLRTRSPLLVEADEPWIESMEVTVAAVNNRAA